jgi:hypothetical protein
MRLMRAWIEEVAFVFFDSDIVQVKPRAFDISGAPSWTQTCSNGDIKIWCWYPYGESGNKIFVLRNWKFDSRSGQFEGPVKYTAESYFVVDEKEEQIISIPAASPVKSQVSSSAAAARGPGDSEVFCASFPKLSRRYHSGFAHDRGHMTTFKGWFWDGAAISKPAAVSKEAMKAAGWDDADEAKRKRLALAWAREVIHDSSEAIFEEKPHAASIPGILEGVKRHDAKGMRFFSARSDALS